MLLVPELVVPGRPTPSKAKSAYACGIRRMDPYLGVCVASAQPWKFVILLRSVAGNLKNRLEIVVWLLIFGLTATPVQSNFAPYSLGGMTLRCDRASKPHNAENPNGCQEEDHEEEDR